MIKTDGPGHVTALASHSHFDKSFTRNVEVQCVIALHSNLVAIYTCVCVCSCGDYNTSTQVQRNVPQRYYYRTTTNRILSHILIRCHKQTRAGESLARTAHVCLFLKFQSVLFIGILMALAFQFSGALAVGRILMNGPSKGERERASKRTHTPCAPRSKGNANAYRPCTLQLATLAVQGYSKDYELPPYTHTLPMADMHTGMSDE